MAETNCALKNDVIHSKRLLLSKSDEILKIHKELYEARLETERKETQLQALKNEVRDLKKRVQQLERAEFVPNLIDLMTCRVETT